MSDDIDFLAQAHIANKPATIDSQFLTEKEEDKVVEAWNNGITSLKAIIQYACGDGVDGRSKKGTAVKAFLAAKNLKANPSHIYKKKSDAIILTEENKEFIANNASSMKLLEMTRIIFDNPKLGPLNKEFLVTKAYFDTLDSAVKNIPEDEDIKEYNPPKQEGQAIARINKYALDAIDSNKLNPKIKECTNKLIKYMHTHRFLQEIRKLTKISERELYESSFVRFTWDKPDLTEEEIDLYLNFCNDLINSTRMQQELISLIEYRDDEVATTNKLPMALVEAIGKLRSDINDFGKKQEKTLQDLNGKRAQRLDKIRADNSSVLTLVEAFRDSERRKRFLDVMEVREKAVKQEAERLESMDELMFEMFGASIQELT